MRDAIGEKRHAPKHDKDAEERQERGEQHPHQEGTLHEGKLEYIEHTLCKMVGMRLDLKVIAVQTLKNVTGDRFLGCAEA